MENLTKEQAQALTIRKVITLAGKKVILGEKKTTDRTVKVAMIIE